MKGMGGHHSARMGKDEWITPPAILRACGTFDLDPCAAIAQPYQTAARMLTIHDDGLRHEWHGRVWLNPPYGKFAEVWLDRLAEHGNGIALIFARTDTKAFQRSVFQRADAVLFIAGRIHFHNADGSRPSGGGGAPSCLIAYGSQNVTALELSNISGKLVAL